MDNSVTAEDMEEAFKLLKEIKAKSSDINAQLSTIANSVEQGSIRTSKGISFLEVKNQMLTSYLANLSHMLCDKVYGKSINGHPSIDRLVEIRTILEKMRPIDQKLKYQIDKVVKTATTGVSENDPLKFRPNVDGLVSKLEEREDSADEAPGVYRPPRLAAVHYDGDETAAFRQEKLLEKAKKRALSSSIMRDLKDQYSEAPEEIRDDFNYHRIKEDKRSKEQEEYEEKYFLRMQATKKQRHQSRQMRTMSGLNQLTKFGDISGLSGGGETSGASGKKRKTSKHSKGKSGSKKRRKFKHL